jgi:glyoxylase-like metal-dependent hydrolase (beta-lactamase superfamily II)
MKTHSSLLLLLGSFWIANGFGAAPVVENVGNNLTVVHGAVNGALLQKQGKVLAFYGDPRAHPDAADMVLFTHHRRDVVWAGRALVEQGAKAVVPAQESNLFDQVESYWSKFQQARIHDYAQQTTKILRESLPVTKTVRGGETILWEGVSIRVLDTPGYTRGAITYLLPQDGKTIAFTGDLIYGDGRLLDLYSMQDAIPEAKIGGYHGYAARLGDLVASLRKVAAEKPDLLIPVRGPLITDPQFAIDRMIKRIEALYANYLSIDALRWYFKEAHIQAKARRVLGTAQVNGIPQAETFPGGLPPWVVAMDNSRLILSADGSGFLIDCGSARVMEELKQRHSIGKLRGIEGIFITHYHDDHTDQVPALVKAFGSTVYAFRDLSDLLAQPSAYRLPCLTTASIHLSGPLSDGATWRWKEFQFTAYDFPGQTFYHDALLVEKDQGEKILFAGDSFTPTGIDDYCLQNRNFLHAGTGFFKCLELVEKLPPETWLINQHVEPAFRFSAEQLRSLREKLTQRLSLLRDLSPWDDPNYLLDEGWARFYPYATTTQASKTARCILKIMNHSPQVQTYSLTANLPRGWTIEAITPPSVCVPPRQEGTVEIKFTVSPNCRPGSFVVSADIQWPGGDLREWTEALIQVEPASRELR